MMTIVQNAAWHPPVAAIVRQPPSIQMTPSLAFTAGKLFLAWVDFTEDVSGVFGRYIDGGQPVCRQPADPPVNAPKARRHTADVRAAIADPLAAPNFGADARVSRYLMGKTPSIAPEVPGQPLQLQWNAMNRRWARRGTVPFDGDYIDIATRPVFTAGSEGNSPAAQLDAE